MSIDRKVVDNTAALARLALAEDERQRLREQLSTVLGHIAVLQEADTGRVSPTAHILPLENVMGADLARPSDPPAELLENAPAAEEQYIRVRAVLEES
jgi:aspartyl-tRNA(Asn)/glutamyl-tRNA(Gln) amidotransferase subunit C